MQVSPANKSSEERLNSQQLVWFYLQNILSTLICVPNFEASIRKLPIYH